MGQINSFINILKKMIRILEYGTFEEVKFRIDRFVISIRMSD